MTSHYHDHYAPRLSEFDRKWRIVLTRPETFDWVTALGFIVVGTLAAVALVGFGLSEMLR